ncbi:hypothetical protein Droror1_Dr00025408 [Drosera rotundifolia]
MVSWRMFNQLRVWIYAAAWEFDHNFNAEAARVMMQSALRACPGSEDLWVEYLRMELTYLTKLKMRKVILGEDVGSLIREDKDLNHCIIGLVFRMQVVLILLQVSLSVCVRLCKEQKLNVVIDPVSAKDLQASFKPQMKPIEEVDEASPNGQPNQSNVQHEDAHLFVFNNGTESISIILFCNSQESG